MPQRLPIPGGDDGTWGGILNGFLAVSLNSDGTLANNVVGTNQIAGGAVTNAQLDSSTQSIIASVAAKYVKPGGGIPSSDLSASVQAALASAASAVQIGGDLGGTSSSPAVAKLNGIALSGTPSANQTLIASSSSAAAWGPLTTSDLPSSVVSVSSGTPSAGQVPIFSGTGNQVVPGSGGLGGYVDVTKPPYNVDPTGGVVDSSQIQAAINAVSTSGGGVVYFPPGIYKKNYALVVKTNIMLKGAGRTATTIEDTTDLGAAYSVSTNEDPNGLAYPGITDMSFVGPGFAAFQAGHVPCAMGGLLLQSNAIVERVDVGGYVAGFAFIGNHQTLRDIRSTVNYYGIYWAPGGNTYANQQIDKAELVQNNMAAIAVHGDNTIDSTNFFAVEIYGAPYALYKENNGSYSKDFISNSKLQLYCEAIGNGMIFDAGCTVPTGGTAGKRISYSSFWNFETWWSSSFAITGTAANWTVVVGQIQNCDFYSDSNDYNLGNNEFLTGTTGVFAIENGYNLKFHQGDVLLENMVLGKLMFIDTADIQGVQLWTLHGGRCLVRKVVGTNPALGDLVYFAPSTTYFGVAIDGSPTGSNIPVGFLQAWGQTTTGHWAPVLVEGIGPWPAITASNIGGPVLITGDTSNRGSVTTTALAGAIGYGTAINGTTAFVFCTIGG